MFVNVAHIYMISHKLKCDDKISAFKMNGSKTLQLRLQIGIVGKCGPGVPLSNRFLELCVGGSAVIMAVFGEPNIF